MIDLNIWYFSINKRLKCHYDIVCILSCCVLFCHSDDNVLKLFLKCNIFSVTVTLKEATKTLENHRFVL